MLQLDRGTDRHCTHVRSVGPSAARTDRILNVAQQTLIDDIEEAGVRVTTLARDAGLRTPMALWNVMSGRARRLSRPTALKVATQLGKPHHASVLAGLPPVEADSSLAALAAAVERSWEKAAPSRLVEVRLETQAGVLQEAVWLPAERRYCISVIDESGRKDHDAFAAKVGRGAELAYQPGTTLICRAVAYNHRALRPGKRVIVCQSLRSDRNELTVRQIEIDPASGGARLLPLGEDQEPIRLPWPYKGRFTAEVGRITIVGVVTATINEEHPEWTS